MTTATEPVITLQDIPAYFGGGWNENREGTGADRRYDYAVRALAALTGRDEDDPALRLIVGEMEDAHGELLFEACNFGRCIPDGTGDSIDEWDDDTLEAITGYRSPSHPSDTLEAVRLCGRRLGLCLRVEAVSRLSRWVDQLMWHTGAYRLAPAMGLAKSTARASSG
jgi:hypothetical protein